MMTLRKLAFEFLVILWGVSASLVHFAFAREDQVQGLVKSIVSEVQSDVRTVNEPFDLYHYSSDFNVQSHIDDQAHQFDQVSQRSGDPVGVRLATDPISFRRQGDTLYRIRVPMQTRYFSTDDYKYNGRVFSAETQKRLSELGCPVSPEKFFYQGSALNPNCTKVLQEVFKRLDVTLLKYDSYAQPLSGCLLPSAGVRGLSKSAERVSAFVLIHPEKIKKENRAVFTSASNGGGPHLQEMRAISQLFHEVYGAIEGAISAYGPPWGPRQDFSKEEKFDLNQWKSEHLLYCRNLKDRQHAISGVIVDEKTPSVMDQRSPKAQRALGGRAPGEPSQSRSNSRRAD